MVRPGGIRCVQETGEGPDPLQVRLQRLHLQDRGQEVLRRGTARHMDRPSIPLGEPLGAGATGRQRLLDGGIVVGSEQVGQIQRTPVA